MHRAYPGLEPRETWATRPPVLPADILKSQLLAM